MMFRCREVEKDYTSSSSMSVRDHREKTQSPRPYKITESYKHSASPLQVNHILQQAAYGAKEVAAFGINKGICSVAGLQLHTR